MAPPEEKERAKPEISNFKVTYKKKSVKRITFIVVCAVICAVAALLAATIGSYPVSAGEVYAIIINAILGNPQSDPSAAHVVLNLRMPAIFGAVVCGFALAVCGTVMQSMLKNPD